MNELGERGGAVTDLDLATSLAGLRLQDRRSGRPLDVAASVEHTML